MPDPAPRETAEFENRLRKMARHWGRWARRQGIGCYRIYDRDVPGFPLAIDRFEDRIHAQLFERSRGKLGRSGGDPHEAEQSGAEQQERNREHDDRDQAWEAAVLEVLERVLEVPRSRIALKVRQRQRAFSQYQRMSDGGAEAEVVVREGPHRFLVNLTDHLDTGLFLDHRQTRAMVGDLARGGRMLNLFAYTGAFTVYAAGAGALETTTLDLSASYLAWTRRNLELNDLWDPERHVLMRADALEWLARARPPSGVAGDATSGEATGYDVIVLDPPTFSRSKRMRGVLDTSRDHPWLIAAAARLLSPRGVLLFSTNARKFRLDPASLPRELSVREITGQTLPPDFRARGAHRAFRITRAG